MQQADLDRLGQHMAKWKQACVQPLQFMLNIMVDDPEERSRKRENDCLHGEWVAA